MSELMYLHLRPNQAPPSGAKIAPYRAVVIVESQVEPRWRATVSEWLVRTGCLYMLAWGLECSAWDDSVDAANLLAFGSEQIPDNCFVFTTWHDHETLDEVFWFAEHGALHPDVDLNETLLIHISERPRQSELLKAFISAQLSEG